uniref:LRP2-binding protein n=1 Tax=Strigamia maritima TaxID=126957 RepID=T1JDM4_STRMM
MGGERLSAGSQNSPNPTPTMNLEKQLLQMIETGSMRALSALGRYYFAEQHFYKALTVLKNCPPWDLEAHYRLGIIYFDGLEIKRDMKRAVKHMKKVATTPVEKSYVPEALIRSAQYFVGYSYYAGFGVITNEDEAIKWWLKAAHEGKPTGSILAQTALGLYYADPWHFDVDRSARWHIMADNNKSPGSKASRAVMCIYGLGKEKKIIKALKNLKDAAYVYNNIFAAGHLVAFYYHRKMFNLAAQAAIRVTSDRLFQVEEQAIKNQSDRKGLALAAFYLGRCYQLGRGVEENIKKAQYLYNKAIKLDYDAMYKLYQTIIQDVV